MTVEREHAIARRAQRGIARLAAASAAIAGMIGFSGHVLAGATTYYNFPGAPYVAISQQGNITHFEGPTGYGHLGDGAYEGYVLCYNGIKAYDIGADQGGFSPTASASCKAGTCTVSRTTADGLVLLTQKFTKPAKSAGTRNLVIDMTIRNNGKRTLSNVILRRMADVEVNTTGALGAANSNGYFASTVDSVFGWSDVRQSHMILLRQIKTSPKGVVAQPKITRYDDDSCSPYQYSSWNYGDFGATIEYAIGSLGPKKSASVQLEYARN